MSIEACQTPNKFHVNSFGNEFTLLVTDYRWCVCLPEIGITLVPNVKTEKNTMFYHRNSNLFIESNQIQEILSKEEGKQQSETEKKRTPKRKKQKK